MDLSHLAVWVSKIHPNERVLFNLVVSDLLLRILFVINGQGAAQRYNCQIAGTGGHSLRSAGLVAAPFCVMRATHGSSCIRVCILPGARRDMAELHMHVGLPGYGHLATQRTG